MSDIDRGAWIPDNDRPNCETFRCPFCGETVFMRRGHATYPTCPWCISDMPDADDLDTPEEVEQIKKGKFIFKFRPKLSLTSEEEILCSYSNV